MTKKISKSEYQKLFEAYLKDQGPNPGSGFFGSWAWHATQKRKFNAKLKKDGVQLDA